MSKIKDENYFVIHGWMMNRLQLKGNELIIYAIIYGFSQTESQWYTGSRKYLSEFAGCTISTVDNCLSSLTQKGYIQKREYIRNEVKFCDYCANYTPAPKIGVPPPQNLEYPPAPKITPHNIEKTDKELDSIETPLYPPAGETSKIASELKKRINALFNRRDNTTWSKKETDRLKQIARRNGVLDECAEIERLYNSGYEYRRRAVQTFLNNWETELDRARIPANRQGKDYFSGGRNIETNNYDGLDDNVRF